MNKLFLIATFFVITLVNTVQAEEKNSSIHELFSIIGIDKQMNGGFEAMLPMVDQFASQLMLDETEKDELKSIYRDWFDNDIDRKAIIEQMVTLYSENFNENEIVGLIDFYKTPLGQKFLQKSPVLMKQGAQIGMQEAQKKQQQLLDKLNPFLEKHKQ